MTNSDQSGLAYESLLLDGYVLPKFDLSKATVGTDGVTYTIAEGQWSTILTIDNSKSSFDLPRLIGEFRLLPYDRRYGIIHLFSREKSVGMGGWIGSDKPVLPFKSIASLQSSPPVET